MQHPIDPKIDCALIERKDEYRNTLVKRGSTLGANCTIVCGVIIDDHQARAAWHGVSSMVSVNRSISRKRGLAPISLPLFPFLFTE